MRLLGVRGVVARWRALRLRRDVERSLAVVAPALAERYGAGLTERLTDDARAALERQASRVPWEPGPRGAARAQRWEDAEEDAGSERRLRAPGRVEVDAEDDRSDDVEPAQRAPARVGSVTTRS